MSRTLKRAKVSDLRAADFDDHRASVAEFMLLKNAP